MRRSCAGQTRVPRAVVRRSRQTLLLQDGSLVLVIVLGMPDGRWHAEFTVATSAAREASRLLRHVI